MVSGEILVSWLVFQANTLYFLEEGGLGEVPKIGESLGKHNKLNGSFWHLPKRVLKKDAFNIYQEKYINIHSCKCINSYPYFSVWDTFRIFCLLLYSDEFVELFRSDIPWNGFLPTVCVRAETAKNILLAFIVCLLCFCFVFKNHDRSSEVVWLRPISGKIQSKLCFSWTFVPTENIFYGIAFSLYPFFPWIIFVPPDHLQPVLKADGHSACLCLF